MATLYYRDPATQQWVTLGGANGPTGPAGPPGPPGPVVVSGDTGNAATISTFDGLVLVTGVDTNAMDVDYVNLTGDTMVGELKLPDQVAAPPSVDTAVTAKGYVDQIVNVDTVDPDPVANAPVRDGLIWNVVGDYVPPPPAPPTGFTAVWVDVLTNTLTWVDSV